MISRISIVVLLLLLLAVLSRQVTAFLNLNPLESQKRKARPFVESHTTFAKKKSEHKAKNDYPFEDSLLDEWRHIRVSENPYNKLFTGDIPVQERPEHVYVILFNPETEQQGVHSVEYPKGSGSNYVLAFRSLAACQKFSASLRAQNFEDPRATRYRLDTLERFCDRLGVYVQVIPKDVNLVPPTQTVEAFGHNPHLIDDRNNLEYIFDMFELEVSDDGLLVEEDAGSWE